MKRITLLFAAAIALALLPALLHDQQPDRRVPRWHVLSAATTRSAAARGDRDGRLRMLTRLYKAHEFKGGVTLSYRLLEPPGLEADDGGSKYPLVVCLHGVGGRGEGNLRNLGGTYAAAVLAEPALREKHPCFVLVPQCPPGRTWSARPAAAPHLAAVLQLVDTLLKDRPVDPDRVYVTGQSMGGYGTWAALAARPGLFAAAMPVCGGGDPAAAARFKHVPVWAFHGERDTTVRPEQSQRMIAALKAAGASPKYTEFPGVGHGCWLQTYTTPGVWDWLFDQRRPKPTTRPADEGNPTTRPAD